MPSAYVEITEEESEEIKRRRTDLCPDEWSESFGEEFYDHALEHSFYFLAPKTEWRSDTKSVIAPGIPQMPVKTEDELEISIEQLKDKGDNTDG